jgi:hypothetical protein
MHKFQNVKMETMIRLRDFQAAGTRLREILRNPSLLVDS